VTDPTLTSGAGDETVKRLRTLEITDDREQRTTLLRHLAADIVAIREHYPTPESRPDWSGRMHYRCGDGRMRVCEG
jgi:hypothetical protein